ncbi:DUF937 domain-containing protein [Roseovarius sp. C7]|uniref:DUF937 domain-containing protein n=1 Tax=Roseovarius sp. C7 TaxID=3398643 RepID=UPI0039F46DD6
MLIMKLLQQAQNGQGLNELAAQFGLDEDKANQLAGMLAPAIGSATKQRAAQGGLGDVLGALKGQDQAENFDNARAAVSSQGQQQGADFLEKILGSREQAQGLAHEAANRVGAEPNLVEQFLPALAAMVQGGLQKQMPDDKIDGMMGQLGGGAQASGGGLMGMIGGLLGGKKSGAQAQDGGFDLSSLNNLLDADGDGSAMDDILGKFMR